MAIRGNKGKNPVESGEINRTDRKLTRASKGHRTGDPAADALGDLRRATDKDIPKD